MKSEDRESPSRPAADDDDIEILEIEGMPDPAVGTGDGDGAAAPDPTEALRAEVATLRDDLLRARADFENFRKRQERDRSEFARRAAVDLVEQLLPILDNFRRALSGLEGGAAPEGAGWLEGVRLIEVQLLETLGRAGLQPVAALGQPFDPHVHEAVAREESHDVEPGTVTAELEPGWMFRDRLLKPARVRVAVAPGS